MKRLIAILFILVILVIAAVNAAIPATAQDLPPAVTPESIRVEGVGDPGRNITVIVSGDFDLTPPEINVVVEVLPGLITPTPIPGVP